MGIFFVALLAGFIGAILGLGGGIFLVPALTLLLGIPMKFAVPTSLLAVVTTSIAASSIYIKKGLTNIKLGLILEITTVLGALAGSLAVAHIEENILAILFALVAFYTAFAMWRSDDIQEKTPHQKANHTKNTLLDCSGKFKDPSSGETIAYTPKRLLLGMAFSTLGGIISALLGIGGGPIKVPIMRLVMGLPLKAATATSTFMVGITASVSAVIYLFEGMVKPDLAIPAVLGIFIGARTGALVAGKMKSHHIRTAFSILLVLIAIEMLLKGLGR